MVSRLDSSEGAPLNAWQTRQWGFYFFKWMYLIMIYNQWLYDPPHHTWQRHLTHNVTPQTKNTAILVTFYGRRNCSFRAPVLKNDMDMFSVQKYLFIRGSCLDHKIYVNIGGRSGTCLFWLIHSNICPILSIQYDFTLRLCKYKMSILRLCKMRVPKYYVQK